MQRRSTISLTLCILLLCFPIPITAQSIEYDNSFIPGDLYDSRDILENKNLEQPVTCGIEGSSGEFSWEQNMESGILNLNWTHVAGTELEHDYSDSTPPFSFDFVYFSLDFHWDEDVIPTFANVSMRLNATPAGDFQDWPEVSEIWIWLVSPTGYWYRVDTFYPFYGEYHTDWTILGDWAIELLFQDLIDSGTDSTARLIIGMVPTWDFINFSDGEIWRTYNGSVQFSFDEVNMNLLYRTENPFPNESKPLYEIDWQQGDSDYYRDSCLLPDGRSLMLSSYEINNMIVGSSLTMLNTRAEILWRKTWNVSAPTIWHDVCFFSNIIYLLGTVYPSGANNIQLRALNLDGEFLWSKNFDNTYGDQPRDLVIDRNGGVYIGLSEAQYLNRNHPLKLLKVDTNGDVVWEEELGHREWDDILSLSTSEDGSIFILSYFQLSKWSGTGEIEWNLTDFYDEVCVLNDGSIITAQEHMRGELNISKFDINGNRVWSKILSIVYSEGWHDYLGINAMIQSYDGMVYLLLALGGYHPGRLILKLDTDGNQVENATLVISDELYMSFNKPQYLDILISDSNLVYLFGRTLDTSWDYSITAAVYNTGPLVIGSTVKQIITTSVAVIVVILTVAIWNYWQKKR